jgi:hypothetical protein
MIPSLVTLSAFRAATLREGVGLLPLVLSAANYRA